MIQIIELNFHLTFPLKIPLFTVLNTLIWGFIINCMQSIWKYDYPFLSKGKKILQNHVLSDIVVPSTNLD